MFKYSLAFLVSRFRCGLLRFASHNFFQKKNRKKESR